MKTAISVPDDTFRQASERAETLGISRSEFFASAARRYLEELDAAADRAAIDEVLAQIGAADTGAAVAVSVGQRVLAVGNDW